jgi:small subunit ribosomal protein S10
MVTKKVIEVEQDVKPKLRIKLRAYDHKVIDKSAREICETALRYNAEISGPGPLPTETHKYTVNRSTFVHKDAREQFEMRVHKRLIDLGIDERALRLIMRVPIPEGLNIEIEMIDN